MADEPAPTPSDQPAPPRQPRAKWQTGASDADAGSSRGPVRAAVLIAFMAAAGSLLTLWFWFAPPTPPHLITVPVSEYSDPVWPANPFAEQDSELLVSMTDVFPKGEKAFNFQEFDRLAARLKSLKVESDQAVVLHLTGLACARDGVVYLLPGQAKPDDPATWLKLSDVLDACAACPAKEKLLLLLDVVRPLADPYRGALVNDVGDRLDAALTKAKPNFLVLSSCGPGEVSLPLDDVQTSAFIYYVVQGLSGAADRYNTGHESNSRVSARELAAFVTARVSRWAKQARGERQTPTLYGAAADFPLTFKPQVVPERGAASASVPPALLDGWKRRDDARAASAHLWAPAAFALRESALIRAERGWRAGVAFKLDAPPPNPTRPEDAPLRSLIAARTGRATLPPELVKALENYLANRFAAVPPKPEALQAVHDEFVNKAKTQKPDAAKVIWEQLLTDPELAEVKPRELASLLDKVQPPASEEGLLLKRLATWKSLSINWPRVEAHVLIEAENAAGQAFALFPGAFPWVREQLDEADRAKREGEQQFFAAKTSVEVRAAAERLIQARNGFTAARKQLEGIQAARRALADAAVILVGTASGVIAGNVDENLWRPTAESAAIIAELLTRPADGRTLPTTLGDQITALQSGLRQLETPYVPAAVKKQLAAATANPEVSEYKALRALLRGPLLKAPERKDAWKTTAELSGKLQEEVVKLDTADDEAHRVTLAPPAAAPDGTEAERAARRVRVSVALLRLTGLDGADRLDAIRRAASGAAPDWPALATDLRDAWTKRLPGQYRQRVTAGDWPAADRLSRGPGLLGVGSVEQEAPPAVRLRLQDELACRLWLVGHYQEYGRLRASVPGAVEFYEDAAAESRR